VRELKRLELVLEMIAMVESERDAWTWLRYQPDSALSI
jgi:hypothetical protein